MPDDVYNWTMMISILMNAAGGMSAQLYYLLMREEQLQYRGGISVDVFVVVVVVFSSYTSASMAITFKQNLPPTNQKNTKSEQLPTAVTTAADHRSTHMYEIINTNCTTLPVPHFQICTGLW